MHGKLMPQSRAREQEQTLRKALLEVLINLRVAQVRVSCLGAHVTEPCECMSAIQYLRC